MMLIALYAFSSPLLYADADADAIRGAMMPPMPFIASVALLLPPLIAAYDAIFRSAAADAAMLMIAADC